MAAPFTPRPGRGTDEYRCFLLDPKLTSAAYLTGSQFQPQNAAIVHHAIVFRVDGGEVAQAAKAITAARAGPASAAPGSAGSPASVVVDRGWRPGRPAPVSP